MSAPFCDLLSEPQYRRRILLAVPRGSLLHASFTRLPRERFCGVFFAGKTAYVPTKALRPFVRLKGLPLCADPNVMRKRLCDDALSYLGTPYRYGGKSASGVDCSGLCFMAYYLNGFPLARDAVFDKRYVYDVGRGELEAGDLVYFRGHVGLYIGDGEYVHASASAGYVTVSSLDARSVIYRRDLAESVTHYARSLLL